MPLRKWTQLRLNIWQAGQQPLQRMEASVRICLQPATFFVHRSNWQRVNWRSRRALPRQGSREVDLGHANFVDAHRFVCPYGRPGGLDGNGKQYREPGHRWIQPACRELERGRHCVCGLRPCRGSARHGHRAARPDPAADGAAGHGEFHRQQHPPVRPERTSDPVCRQLGRSGRVGDRDRPAGLRTRCDPACSPAGSPLRRTFALPA